MDVVAASSCIAMAQMGSSRLLMAYCLHGHESRHIALGDLMH